MIVMLRPVVRLLALLVLIALSLVGLAAAVASIGSATSAPSFPWLADQVHLAALRDSGAPVLLVTDDGSGTIWRISATDKKVAAQ